ncbi:MBL fold metallo-hydrolase [Floccifex sp.]|uniref:MBL fold metallo-hydrolase n=1 Tax=Floccifex sp. TaxID=2815810 RepID=UPI003F06442B
MKIVNLIENTSSYPFLCEHGLSFYIETNNHKILVDTGQSDLFIKNAQILNIDLSKVDLVFISHGHYDHAGGLQSFLEINHTAIIYIHQEAKKEFYSLKNGKEKYIGINPVLWNHHQIRWIDSNMKIDEIEIFTDVIHEYFWPQSNLRLKYKDHQKLQQDDFAHEIYIVIHQKQTILISGCAHNGIVNILNTFHKIYKKDPDIVISGFHLIRSNYESQDIQMIQDIAIELKKHKCIYYTGHCTGDFAYKILKNQLQNQIHKLETGKIINTSSE